MEKERAQLTEELLALKFEHDPPYTIEELAAMTDEELAICYLTEMREDAGDTTIDIDRCSICNQMKECPYEDSTTDLPVCAECVAADSEDGSVDIVEEESSSDDEEEEEEEGEGDDEDDDGDIFEEEEYEEGEND